MNREEAILNLLKKNESEAFRLLFERYYDNLLLYCYHILHDLNAAEDIVQECFVSLWNRKRLNSFTGDLERFIFKMVKNSALMFLRERKKIRKSRPLLSERARLYIMISLKSLLMRWRFSTLL